MRILKFLLSSLIVIAIVSGLGFLLAREALLIWGVARVRTSLSKIKSISKNPTNYARQCRQMGADPGQTLIYAYQLRFTSDKSYVTEVVCEQFQNNPIQVESNTLPFFIKKLPGSSGIIWGDSISGIALEVWGRKRAIIVEKEEILYENYDDSSFLGVSPLSSCVGFGFNCCNTQSSQGVGEQYTGVNDCPKTCFSGCSPRPILLSFISDPFPDIETKIARVGAGETVVFNYVLDDQGVDGNTVVIDFGDGQSQSSDQISGFFEHVYSCTGSCSYVAKIDIKNSNGVSAADTPVNQIRIQVR